MIDLRRGDVVLVSFPFVTMNGTRSKRRPAVVVQSDRYRRRTAVILAAVTTSAKGRDLPCKVFVASDSPEGREAGFRIDSVVDCQTLATLPRSGIVARLGRVPAHLLADVDRALEDALGVAS